MVKSIGNTTKPIVLPESTTTTQSHNKTELPVTKKVKKSVETNKLFQQKQAERRYRAIKAKHKNIPDNIQILPYEIQEEIVSKLVNRCTSQTLVNTLGNLVQACPTLAPLADELGARFIEERGIPISSLGFTTIQTMVSFAAKLGPHLKHFAMSSTGLEGKQLEDADIKKLVEACPNLETLELHFACSCQLSDVSLATITQLKNLKKFTINLLEDNTFGYAGFFCLSSLQSLQELNIYGLQNTTDQLSYLSALTQLEKLTISDYALGQASGLDLGTFTKLKHLDVTNCYLDDEAVRQISSLPELESLDIGYNKNITTDVVPFLAKMTQLKTLSILGIESLTDHFSYGANLLSFLETGDKLNSNRAYAFADFGFNTAESAVAFAKKIGNNLENFHLSYSSTGEISDQDIEELVASCPNLKFIVIGNPNQLSNRSLELLSSLQHLEALYIFQNDTITDTGLKTLRRCKNLTELAISNQLISDEGLSYLSQISTLQMLTVGNSGFITDRGIWHLTALQNLKRLNITDCRQVTKSSVRSIAKMKLQELGCEGTGLPSNILDSLKEYHDWGIVKGLANDGFDTRSAIEFAKNIGPNLLTLNLDDLSDVSDKDIEKLVEACPNLGLIVINHSNKITTRSLERLATLPQLQTVRLIDCPLITLEESRTFNFKLHLS